jgi:hypothetical protein
MNWNISSWVALSQKATYHIFIIMVELTIGFDDLNAFFWLSKAFEHN